MWIVDVRICFRSLAKGLGAQSLEIELYGGGESEKKRPRMEYISSSDNGLFFEILKQRHHITQSALEPFLRQCRHEDTISDQ